MSAEVSLRKQIDYHAARLRYLRKQLRKSKGLPAKKKGLGCRIGDRDLVAMALRDFKDPSSYIRRSDGGEVLHGQDWRDRKVELRDRAGGRCEYEAPWKIWPLGGPALERCVRDGMVPAHIEPRHPRRDDRMSNLKLYCFEHDRLTEKQNWRRIRSGKVGATK